MTERQEGALALGTAAGAALLVLPASWALVGGGFGPVLLPVGPPWAPLSVALDPLSAWFLLLLGVTAAPAALFAARSGLPRPAAVLLPCFVLAMALTVLAADTLTLLLGFEAVSAAAWAILLASGERRAARLFGAYSLLSGVALLGVLALLARRASPSRASASPPPRAGGARPSSCWCSWAAGPGRGWCRCTRGCRWRTPPRPPPSRR